MFIEIDRVRGEKGCVCGGDGPRLDGYYIFYVRAGVEWAGGGVSKRDFKAIDESTLTEKLRHQ